MNPYLTLAQETTGMGAELLTFPTPLELFADGDDDGKKGTFRGMGTVFGNIIDSWIPTTFKQGAFAETIAEDFDRIVILQQHDALMLLGKPTKLTETVIGLEVEGQISDTQAGRDALTLMRDGVLSEMSVGFDPLEWEIDEESPLANGGPFRTITKARLGEISIAVFARDDKARILEVNSAATRAYCERHGLPTPCELQAAPSVPVFFTGLEQIFSGYPELPDIEGLAAADRASILEAATFFAGAVEELGLKESEEVAGGEAGTEEQERNDGSDPVPFDPDLELASAEFALAELDLATVTL